MCLRKIQFFPILVFFQSYFSLEIRIFLNEFFLITALSCKEKKVKIKKNTDVKVEMKTENFRQSLKIGEKFNFLFS